MMPRTKQLLKDMVSKFVRKEHIKDEAVARMKESNQRSAQLKK